MRNRNRDDFRGDRSAIESRRANAEGRPPRHVPPSIPDWEWITDKAKTEQACLQILRGEPGLYPIFGIQLHVEERQGNNEKFAILVYTDAKLGEEGQNLCGNLREGFWIGVKDLLANPAEKEFKTADNELLTLTLLGQPEMQIALGMFKKERAAAWKRAQEEEAKARQAAEENKKDLIAGLRNKVIGTGGTPATSKKKPSYPVLDSIKEILTAQCGEIECDGLTILVCESTGQDPAVRLKKVPKDHPMKAIADRSFCTFQNALRYSDDLPVETKRTGDELQKYELRMYLRQQLMLAGVTLRAPVVNERMDDAGGNASDTQTGKAPGAEASAAS